MRRPPQWTDDIVLRGTSQPLGLSVDRSFLAGFWSSATTVDYLLVAPEAVAARIETVDLETLDGDYVPLGFEWPDDEPDDPAEL